MSFTWGMGEQTVAYLSSEIVTSVEKWIIDTYDSMNKPGVHYAKGNKLKR